MMMIMMMMMMMMMIIIIYSLRAIFIELNEAAQYIYSINH